VNDGLKLVKANRVAKLHTELSDRLQRKASKVYPVARLSPRWPEPEVMVKAGRGWSRLGPAAWHLLGFAFAHMQKRHSSHTRSQDYAPITFLLSDVAKTLRPDSARVQEHQIYETIVKAFDQLAQSTRRRTLLCSPCFAG
jgi:hypothetical protein